MDLWRFKASQVTWWPPENKFYNKTRWTCISDIGDFFGDVVLTTEEYLRVEQMYLSFFQRVFEVEGIEWIFLDYTWPIDLWVELGPETEQNKHKNSLLTDELIDYHRYICQIRPDKVGQNEIALLGQLILRRYGGCTFSRSPIRREEFGDYIRSFKRWRRFEIHFGFDYYVYLVTNKREEWEEELNSLGLYLD